MHCYRAANSLGLRIGPFGNGDLAIVGFDPELWMLDPTLTTLTLPFDQLAEALLDLIQHQVAGRAAASTGVLVPTSLLVQDSAEPGCLKRFRFLGHDWVTPSYAAGARGY